MLLLAARLRRPTPKTSRGGEAAFQARETQGELGPGAVALLGACPCELDQGAADAAAPEFRRDHQLLDARHPPPVVEDVQVVQAHEADDPLAQGGYEGLLPFSIKQGLKDAGEAFA